jgi:uncharacterized protein YqeY
MSELLARLQADIATAMRAKEELARDTLRMVTSEVKKRAIDDNVEPTDEAVLAVVRHASKTRQDAAEQFEAAGRMDLATKERRELEVLARYLPRQMNEDEIRGIVGGLVTELGLESKRDMGRLMKALMERHRGVIDGKAAQRFAAEFLQ